MWKTEKEIGSKMSKEERKMKQEEKAAEQEQTQGKGRRRLEKEM